MVRSFDFILGTTAAFYRIFDLHRNDIYAILSEGKNNNIYIYIVFVDHVIAYLLALSVFPSFLVLGKKV